jgi:hypothetical protein
MSILEHQRNSSLGIRLLTGRAVSSCIIAEALIDCIVTSMSACGKIFRRNMPYGNVDDHGTVFVGFSADQKGLSRMLDTMAGLITGTRDALTHA